MLHKDAKHQYRILLTNTAICINLWKNVFCQSIKLIIYLELLGQSYFSEIDDPQIY